jgi:hypothetical protein
MPFIGKQPIVGNFQVCDAISVVNGQAAYTLQVNSTNVEPETANHMLVSLNGVLQKPGSSFTISGATLTFASNLATGDVIDFVILLGDVLNIGAPSDGTVGLNQLSATGTKDATTFLRGDNTFASAGGDNTPIFSVHLNSDQTLNDNTATKIQFNTEDVDTDNAFDNSSNYRFTVPSGEGGKYLLQSCIRDFDDQAKLQERRIMLYKNGSEFARQWFYPEHDHGGTATAYMEYGVSLSLNIIVDASASDYYEIYYYGNTRDSGSFLVQGDGTVRESWFQGHKLIT